MATRRLQLQELLELTLGSTNVYFQPPPTIQMTYPCIVYKRDKESVEYANNKMYTYQKRYQVTVIDPDPDSDIPAKIRVLPTAIFNRFYTAHNLNHDVFHLYF